VTDGERVRDRVRSAVDVMDGASGKSSANARAETMCPVTVKMIKRAMDDAGESGEYKYGGLTLGNVTLVGKVVGVKDGESNTSYTVDDGTGTCVVRVWNDGEGEGTEPFALNTYIRAYGQLKSLSNEKCIAAHNSNAVRAITDFNEVTFHQLEVVYANAHSTTTTTKTGVANGSAPSNVYSAAPVQAAPTAVQGNMMSENIHDAVSAVLHLPEALGEHGLHLGEVTKLLNGRFTADAVRQAMDDMANDGMVYSTVDDDHFRATDIM
jgi:replication factor A2